MTKVSVKIVHACTWLLKQATILSIALSTSGVLPASANDEMCLSLEAQGKSVLLGIDSAYFRHIPVPPSSIFRIVFRYRDLAPMGKSFTIDRFDPEKLTEQKGAEALEVTTFLTIAMKSRTGFVLHLPKLPGRMKLPGWQSYTCEGCISEVLIPDSQHDAPHHLECPSAPMFTQAQEKRFSCTVYDVVDGIEVQYVVPKQKIAMLSDFRDKTKQLIEGFRVAGNAYCPK
ncbi:MAG: hypothetical protein IPK59_09250 [Rhodospirillaceae bacterium]|nr:hypothetical protein [Rhodospirillaceae bacterium]